MRCADQAVRNLNNILMKVQFTWLDMWTHGNNCIAAPLTFQHLDYRTCATVIQIYLTQMSTVTAHTAQSEHSLENFGSTLCTSYTVLPMSCISSYFLIPFEFNISGFDCAYTNPQYVPKMQTSCVKYWEISSAHKEWWCVPPYRNAINVRQTLAQSQAKSAHEPRLPSAACSLPVKCHRE